MRKEIWKDIKNYEGLYQVSNWGRVRSLKFGKIRILKACKDKDGYLIVTLYKSGQSKIFKVHRLVAETFIPNPDNLPITNHKNELKYDNRVENLEWCDAKYNTNYGNGIKKRIEKTSKPIFQFTLDGVLVKEWPSINEVGRYGFSRRHITACCRGERKTHKGYIWKYKNEC